MSVFLREDFSEVGWPWYGNIFGKRREKLIGISYDNRVKKIIPVLLSLTFLTGCSSQVTSVALDDYWGVEVPKFVESDVVFDGKKIPGMQVPNRAIAIHYEKLATDKVLTWLEEENPGEVSGMTRRVLKTDYANSLPDVAGRGPGVIKATSCWSTDRDLSNFIAEKTSRMDVYEMDDDTTLITVLVWENGFGCEDDAEYQLYKPQIERMYGQKNTGSGDDLYSQLSELAGAFAGGFTSGFLNTL